MNKHHSLRVSYRCLNFMVMLYFTMMIITIALIYKIVDIHGYAVSASSLVIPLWYALGDVIAEVYGYKISRQLIWAAIFCEFIFIFVCAGLVHVASPYYLHNGEAYRTVFGALPRVFVGSVCAILLGGFINIYVITKWKILVSGRYFWIRSTVSSTVGELVFVITAFLIEFYGKVPFLQLLRS